MNYKGSKRRLVKHYKDIIEQYITPQTDYVEPFVGGCNMITEINANTKFGNDCNKYLIGLLKRVQSGFNLPVWIDEEEYKRVRSNPQNYPDWYVGYCGFICSYRNDFFKGYNGIRQTKKGERNYQEESKNALQKMNLNNIIFSCGDYQNMKLRQNSVIYCDAPYKDTDKYKTNSEFDYNVYYDWLRQRASEGHKIFVSELNMPSDFTLIKEVEIQNCLKNENKMIERLYTL